MYGVLLVLHGSKIKEWQDVAIQYANLLRKYFDLVEYGFIEFNQPSITEAAKKLASNGVDTIIVVPLLFAAGTHFKRDIPKQLEEIKGVKIMIAEPIGVDERIAEILKERVEEVLRSSTRS
ncbi:CbiX/SirB N-terminal domain-containing protein [Sulfurisphaera tokodaii]|uniref:Sirohydrochlorin cobaltochelatase n=2 Tax=Sulfurisphaera tokodaii TaxID=111955 RepID=CBIX_SULTO|nr:CbiX/SirB N-terminal domain-containing protein [Sulfurisphaera tokodaii]Q975N6.1 RecName: Full=Sirohydrochlorin cobaltochelatase; AltName: Full=CbiXS [Sulfurisphaera tokodaii str. 7]BAB65364.1 sirohydrochlorin cobaltochelatase CbiXS [Sulfurisphaera tokodaii str. 7]HII74937.1 sirohydrochlorin cobaltochelatase [Sulfurisphaera tokodaii]